MKKVVILIVIALIVGFFGWREYSKLRAGGKYSACVSSCDQEARSNLPSYEERTDEIISEVDSKLEGCLDSCIQEYEKITGEEVEPVYKQMKAMLTGEIEE